MREPSGTGEEPAEAAMSGVDGRAVHEGAAADDGLDAEGFAFADGFGGDAAGAEGAVEPDDWNALGGALADDIDGDTGMGGNDDAVNGAGDGGKVRVAFPAVDFGGIRVKGKDLEAGVMEFLPDGVCRLMGLAGDAGDGKPFAGQERGNAGGDGEQGDLRF